MEAREISVNIINISASVIAVTSAMGVADVAGEVVKSDGLNGEVPKDCAKVSAVGADMTGDPGVLATLTSTLIDNDVQILQAADSHTTIWVLIRVKHIKKAVNALHEAFELDSLNKQLDVN